MKLFSNVNLRFLKVSSLCNVSMWQCQTRPHVKHFMRMLVFYFWIVITKTLVLFPSLLTTNYSTPFLDTLWTTSLSELYKNVLLGKDMHRSRFFHMPKIFHAQDSDKYLNNPDLSHEAGFDAFMSGSVFITLAHIMAGLNYL